MASRLIGWGVLALIAGAIWAVLDWILRWLGFAFYWKTFDGSYRQDMPGRSFSERWSTGRGDYAEFLSGGMGVALSVVALIAAVRIAFWLRAHWLRADRETAARRPPDLRSIERAVDADIAARKAAGETATHDRDAMIALVRAGLDDLREDAVVPGLAGAWDSGAAVERVFPPPTEIGLSFLGGLPVARSGFAWPRGPDGSPSFVAQIAMSDLPEFPTRSLFPDDGVLYFFLPSLEGAAFGGDGVGSLVVHEAGDGPRAEVTPPTDLPRHGDGTTGRQQRWPLRLSEARLHLTRGALYPRHPVRLRPVTRDDAPKPGPFPRLPERIGAETQRAGWADLSAIRAGTLIGPPRGVTERSWKPPVTRAWRPDRSFPSDWLQIDLLAGAAEAHVMRSIGVLASRLATGRKDRDIPFDAPDGPWPGLDAFLSADYEAKAGRVEPDATAEDWAVSARDTARTVRDVARGDAPPHDPEEAEALRSEIARHEAALVEAGDWIARAEAGIAEGDAPDEEAREAFWAFWSGIAEQRLVTDHARIGPLALGNLLRADRTVRDALAHAAEERLADGGTAPADLVAALAARHAPGAKIDGGSHGSHRIGGAPDVVQDAGDLMIGTHVLLLQLSHDDPMGFRFGDVGVFQWWIRPDDLAARRWDRVELVFEGH